MTRFWAVWIIVLLTVNLGIMLFLFVWGQIVRIPTEPDGTTGHVWAHGVLREGVRNLPLWWALISVGVILFGLIYFIRYPALGNYKGTLNWTSQQQYQRDTEANNARLEARLGPLRGLSLEQLAARPEATTIGHRLYLDNCSACHGTEARGNQVIGAPDLTDVDWLYGGDDAAFMASILDGRNGIMPALGTTLGHQGVNEAAAYVLTFSGVTSPEGWAAAGKTRFETLCIACHGADGHGNPALGAPNLTDKSWLYGGEFERVAETIRDGRTGVMPGWRKRLTEDQAHMIAAWLIAQRAAPTHD